MLSQELGVHPRLGERPMQGGTGTKARKPEGIRAFARNEWDRVMLTETTEWNRWSKRKDHCLFVQYIRLGDRADIAREQHLDSHNPLPVCEGKVDLVAVLVGLDVFGGDGHMPVEEVEQLSEARGLGGGHLLRKRRPRGGAVEEGPAPRGAPGLGSA